MLLKSTNLLFILGTDSIICGNMRKLLLCAFLCLMYASCSNNNDDVPASIYSYIDEYYETLNKEFSNYGGVNRESANLTIDSINNIKIIQALTNDKSYFVFCVLDIEKNRIINKASIEEPFNILSIHEGYGVYKDYSFRNISDPNFVKTDNVYINH